MARVLSRLLLLGTLSYAACAGQRARPPEPVPPPRGTPPPRLDPHPPAARAPGPTETAQQQFPVLEGAARREERARRAEEAQRRLELVEPPARESCAEVPPEQQRRCPYPAVAVEMLEEIPGGVRLHFRRSSVQAAAIRAVVRCQTALARERPIEPLACPFLVGRTDQAILERQGGRVVAELTVAVEEDVRELRDRAAGAFPRAARPTGGR